MIMNTNWDSVLPCLHRGLGLLCVTGLLCLDVGCSTNSHPGQANSDRQTERTASASAPTLSDEAGGSEAAADQPPNHDMQMSQATETDLAVGATAERDTVATNARAIDGAALEADVSADSAQQKGEIEQLNASSVDRLGKVVQDARVSPSVSELAQPTVPTRRRLLLMPLTGPLVVEWEFTYGPKPLHEKWLASAAVLIEAADSNADGETSWNELLENPMLLQLAFGRMPFEDDRARQTVAMSYDANSNKLVEDSELLRVLGRSFRSHDGLVIQTEPFDPFQRVANSGLYRWLDASGDGILSTEDKRNAAARLRLRDADDDGRLWPGDFTSTEVPTHMNMGMTYQRPRGPVAARAITADTEWGQLLTDLEEIYSFGSALQPLDFASSQKLYAALDTDGSEELRMSEIARLALVPADLTIRFDRQQGALSLASRPMENQPEAASLEDASPVVDRLVINDAATELVVVVVPEDGNGNAPDAVELFARGDRDKNQYLDETEFRAVGLFQFASFENLDRNDDQRVDLPELDLVTKVVQCFHQSGLRLSVRPDADPVFAALDTNGNGRLDTREIAQSPAVLTALDANEDGHLSSSELPSRLEILLSGRTPYQPGQPNAMADTPAYVNRERTDAPNWFTQMDSNRDGEIDPTEFLGTAETFADLDRDGDGFVEVSEIEAMGETR